MRPLVEEHIAKLKPYVPGKPIEELERELGITGAIKLASNENPLGPSPAAMRAMQDAVATMHIYPDGAAHEFKETIADVVGVPFDDIATGNGSNELLTLLVRTFCTAGDHAVISDYSFIAYRVIMQAAGLRWTSVPVGDDYAMDVDAMIEAVRPETRVLFVANPNNPTGTHLSGDEIERLLTSVHGGVIVVLDEAYNEYVHDPGFRSALTMRSLREKLVVTRTFSKVFGLGGVRAGYAIGPAEMMNYLNRVREPFNCNAMAQVGAAAALRDDDFVRRSIEVNESSRGLLESGLRELADFGVTWTPSQTNFLLVHSPHVGTDVYDRMLRQGVIVRPMAGYGLENSVRISLGTEDECRRCVDALRIALEGLTEAP